MIFDAWSRKENKEKFNIILLVFLAISLRIKNNVEAFSPYAPQVDAFHRLPDLRASDRERPERHHVLVVEVSVLLQVFLQGEQLRQGSGSDALHHHLDVVDVAGHRYDGLDDVPDKGLVNVGVQLDRAEETRADDLQGRVEVKGRDLDGERVQRQPKKGRM